MVVSTDQMDMNQGFGSSSMQVTYVTRRGSNDFHGRVYEGYRADILNAKNWGSSVKAKYHQNEFGATLGGPILLNKLFFFASGSALDVPGASRTTRTTCRPREAGLTYGTAPRRTRSTSLWP
jgi:hypothetical protein